MLGARSEPTRVSAVFLVCPGGSLLRFGVFLRSGGFSSGSRPLGWVRQVVLHRMHRFSPPELQRLTILCTCRLITRPLSVDRLADPSKDVIFYPS